MNEAADRKVTSTDMGLLFLRVGIGVMFIVFGGPKIAGGPSAWAELGGAMGALGITFLPAFWGFMAAFAELVGGIALLLGVLVRPFALMMAFTMVVATLMLVRSDAGMQQFAHALNMSIVFFAVAIAGGGRLALGKLIKPISGTWYQ